MLHLKLASKAASIIQDLQNYGYSVTPNLLAPDMVTALVGDVRALQDQGAFLPAAVGRTDQRRHLSEVRSDQTYWLGTRQPESPAVLAVLNFIEILKNELNRQLFLGLWDFEGHYAIYPSGGFYQRHRDRFSDSDLRTVSVVLYLNQFWNPACGGELVIYRHSNPVETVAPMAGTLVTFLSSDIEHEVRKSYAERVSLAGWLRRRGSSC